MDLRTPRGLLALSLSGLSAARAIKAADEGEEPADLASAWERAGQELAAERAQGRIHVSYFDDRYPARLRGIASPPILLRISGEPQALSVPLVAVVGTREPTQFGVSAVEAAVAALAERGFGVVSGLARGIDTVAHRAALRAQAPTVAVLGSGLDRIYPPENRALAEQIVAQGGAIVSELRDGTEVKPRQLIARNRLQSGLAVALVVGQTGLKGGTLHTVRFALEQGRPIWCPEPRAEHLRSQGLSVLLERPASELPDLLPAFASARRLCDGLGASPVARPFTRETLPELCRETAAACRLG